MDTIKIGTRSIGRGSPCFIIAEAGVNHNGEIELARRLIDAAVEAGVDAVKFQAFIADRLVSGQAPKAAYQVETTGEGESQRAMLKKLELPPSGFQELQVYCKKQGVLFLATPFDVESADLLAGLRVPAYKIGSGEITNLPFLVDIAGKGLPIILSTGMADLVEVGEAVRAIRQASVEELVLLHCVSNYPAQPADINLSAMATMRAAFQLPVGYSDHTTGIDIALAAVALGACVIEKHFTLDRNLPGPDHRASLEPSELKAMVQAIRRVESAIGHGRKEPAASEADTALVARKSLVASQDIPAGTRLTQAHIAIQRPGNGLPPPMASFLLGLTLKVDVRAGELFTKEMFA